MLRDVAVNAASYEKSEVWMTQEQIKGISALIKRIVNNLKWFN